MKKTKFARRDRSQRGFTLLEVIFAGALIALVMLAIEPLLVQAFNVDKSTSYRVKAQALTAQKLEDLITLSSTINVANGNLVCDGIPYSDVTDLETGQPTISSVTTALTRTWTIRPVTLSPPAVTSLCTISVATAFTYEGHTKLFQLVSEKGH